MKVEQVQTRMKGCFKNLRLRTPKEEAEAEDEIKKIKTPKED